MPFAEIAMKFLRFELFYMAKNVLFLRYLFWKAFSLAHRSGNMRDSQALYTAPLQKKK